MMHVVSTRNINHCSWRSIESELITWNEYTQKNAFLLYSLPWCQIIIDKCDWPQGSIGTDVVVRCKSVTTHSETHMSRI